MFMFSLSDALLLSLMLAFVTGILGIPGLSFLVRATGALRKKVFMSKLALQLARLGLLFIVAVTLLTGAALAACWHQGWAGETWLTSQQFWEAALYFCLIALIFFGLYFITWNKLSRFHLLHLFPSALAIVAAKAFLALVIWSLWREMDPLNPIWPNPESIFWPILVQVYILSLAAGSALGLLYLLHRRNRDDFGRDYYRFALGSTAKWGIFFSAISPLTCIWLFAVSREALDLYALILPGAGYGLLLTLFILGMLRIAKSTHPLRHKFTILLCPVLIWLIFTARLVSYLEMGDMVTQEDTVGTFIRAWQQSLE